MAYDFNNLLMAILGSLELVQKRVGGQLDAKTLSLLDNAIQGAQRGASLTRRMLAFASRQVLKTEPHGPADPGARPDRKPGTVDRPSCLAGRFSPNLPLGC